MININIKSYDEYYYKILWWIKLKNLMMNITSDKWLMKESESFGSFESSSHCNQIILGFLKIKKLKSVVIE